MPTYSEWLDSTRVLYTTAMTNAYSNRNNVDTTNVWYRGWQAMTATSDLASIVAPNTAFYGGSPDGDEADILLFQGWLQDNPVAAGLLNLEPTLAFRGDQRSSLGSAGKVGTEQRRWKGNPLYTFANGVLVGKNGQIAAAIGTEGGEDLDGFGTDTISYFDGIPFSTGTGVPGTTVFRGDTVVSGSIKGTGGVVIIDDVIQLETGVASPAGIGVDGDGKIRLRHRGEGFKDLIEEIETVQTNLDNSTNTAANLAKLWQGTQNTSSGRWGQTLIPNGNMSMKTVDPNDAYSDRLVGVRSIGTTSNIVSIPADGVGRFDASTGGIVFQAVPVESERYAIRIRYRGGTTENVDNAASDEGLFISFHETTDDPESMGDKSFIYATSATPGVQYEGSGAPATSDIYVTNTLINFPDNSTSEDAGGNIDGVTIQTTYQVKSFVYEPSASAKSASLVLYARNYSDNIDIDYVVMTESPLSTTEIDGLIDVAKAEIQSEIADPDVSVVSDPQMKDYTLWAGYNGATLANGTDGITGGDEAILVSVPSGGGGIVSSAIACESDRYLVGAKVRVISSVGNIIPDVSMFAIENTNQVFSQVGNVATTPLVVGSGNVRKDIDIIEVGPNGAPLTATAGSTISVPIAKLDGSEPLYTTLVGTYEVGTIGTYDPSAGTTISLPSLFSLVVNADTECELSVDYVYGRLQGASVNIAQSLADSAYTDAHGFVTDMNEQLIKEQGSIISNAGMSILDSNNKPAGWRTDVTSGTLTLVTTGDNAIKITQETGQTGQRRLITPAFSLGTADKFSIGIRIRGINGSIDVQPKVAVTGDNTLPSPYVTLAGADGGNADVLVPTDVSETSVGSAVTVTETVDHESILVTWNKGTTTHGGLASIIIEADDDFEVDFVFVKEQTVSYDLADSQAIARRDEAVASAAGFVANIGDSLAQETGSLLTNADFTSWYIDGGKQRPQKWLVTRGGSNSRRVIRSTEVSSEILAVDTDADAAETVDDQNQTGSSIRFSPSSVSGGILSAKWQLPIQDEDGVAAGTATTGSYTLSARVKVGSASVIGVRLYAHESFDYTDASQEHVFCEDGTYGSATVEGADRTATGTPLDTLFMFADGATTGQVTRIGVINVSNPTDTTPGYDPNYTNDGVDNDYADAGDDQYVEYIPLDNDGVGGYEDGDLDATIENQSLWYDIGGTFKPDAKTKCVSFEILIDGDPDNSAGAPTNVYVDYVSLVQQPFDSDFATTLADARVNSLTGISSESFGSSTDPTTGAINTTLAAAILANQQRIYTVNQTLAAEDESTTLVPNSFFSDHTTNVPDLWLPTRNTDGTLTLEDDETAIENAGSYNTYVEMGGTNDVRGILSNAIPVIGDGDNTLGLTSGGLSTNPKFDLAIRYKSPALDHFSLFNRYSDGTITTVGTETNTSLSINQDAPLTSMYHEDTNTTLQSTETGLYINKTYTLLGNQYYQYDTTLDVDSYNTDEAYYPEEYMGFFRMATGASVTTDPEITFTSAATGYVRVYETNGTVVNTFTLSSTSSVDISGLSGSSVYWFQMHLENPTNTWRITNPAGNVQVELSHVTNNYDDTTAGNDPLWTSSMTEVISFQIIAHEYFGNAYNESTSKYVYANGANYIHPTTYNSVVQRYNTGSDGRVQALNTILNNGVDTTEETEKVTTSTAWQVLVGEYEPHTSAQWVSFEFVIDHDNDNDNYVPDVFVDGILLQASPDPNKSLLDTVKETAEAAQTAAGNAQSDATQALSDAGDALANAASNLTTINGHTTSLANIELAQSEAAIIRTGIASEQGSILFNAGFSETITSSNKAHPLGFFPFRNTPALIRITNETATGMELFGTQGNQTYSNEVFDSPSSIYLDVGQRGSAVAVTTTNHASPYSAGFYSRAMPLPKVTASITSLIDGSESDQDSRGIYSIAVQVRSSQSTGVSVSIKALEYDNNVDTDNYISETFENTYDIYGARSEWDSPSGSPVTATRVIDVTGTQIDENDTTATDWEIVGASGWTTIAGTYSPTSTAEFVSFAVIFTTDVNDETADTVGDTPDGQTFWSTYNIGSSDRTVRALAYVDYILVTPASVSADLAADLAAGKAYEVQQDLKGDLTDLEDNLGAESDSLMPNGNFQQVYTDSSTDYIKNWMYTRALTASGIQPSAAANGSIGTYVDVPLPSDSTTNTVGGGIISKSVEGLYTQSVQEGGSLGSFNLGLRCRGVTGLGSSTVSIASGDQNSASVYRQYISWAESFATYISGYDSTNANTAWGSPNEVYDTDSASYRGLNISKLVDAYSSRYYRLDPPASNVTRSLTLTLPFTPQSGCKLIHLYIGLRAHTSWDMFNLSTWRVSTHNSTDDKINFGKISVALANDYTTDGDISNWNVKANEVDAFRTNYFTMPSSFKDSDNNWIRITIDAGVGGADNALQYLNKVKITNETYGGGVYANTWAYFSNPQWVEVFDPSDHSYTVQIIAHEYTGTSDPNTLFHKDTVTVPSGHSDNMTITSTSQVNLVPLNLIDLRYSESIASTEITIGAFDQDTNEYITDWRNIVGSYTPSSSTVTATAFEFLFEGDPDSDSNYQTIHVDSVTMAASSLSTDLASTISDNRIFVEQKFIGGGSVVDQNSVIFNGDFAIAAKTFPNNDTLFPTGWFPWYNYETEYERDHGIDDSTIWGYGSNSTGTNRVIEWRPAMSTPANTDTDSDGDIDSNDDLSGLLGMTCRPFKVGSNKYTFRMTYRLNSTAVDGDECLTYITPYICYSATDISPDVVSILSTVPSLSNQSIRPSTATTIDSNGNVMNDSGVNYALISFESIAIVGHTGGTIYDPSGNDDPFGRIQTLEATWNVKTPLSNLDPAKWCCFNILCYSAGADNLKVSSIEVVDVQLVPTGQAYGAGTLTAPGFASPDWDDEDDVAPSAPRDIEEKEPLYNGSDIEIADISTISDTKDRLILALPRKVFTDTTGTTVDTTKGTSGTSYLYPGVSDLEYASGNATYSQKTGGRRQLIFNEDAYNEIVGVQRIEFNNWASDDANFADGFGWELIRSAAHILSIRSGDTGNDPYYRFNFRGDGAAGIGGFQLEVQNDPYVRTWNNGTTSNYTNDAFITLRPTREDFASGDTGVANNGRIRLEFWIGNSDSDESSSTTGTNDGNFFGYMQNSYSAASITFTGQHRNVVKDTELLENNVGLIVVSTGIYDNLTHGIDDNKPHINEALPLIELSSKRNQKSVWGVISGEEDINDDGSSRKTRSHLNGVWGSVIPVKEDEDDRLIINSLGEGAVWICNINGNLENGDYITTSEIPGYGMLQDDDLLHNYTVAKITQDCNFELDNPRYDCVEFEHEGNTYRKAFVGCTYHCG